MKRELLVVVTVALATLEDPVATAAETSPACSAPEYRQFDFWIGAWDVFDPAGKKVGDSRIERINQGCGLLENWSGAGGSIGKSLNMYDATDHLWHQFWIDNQGGRLALGGGLAAGKMVLTATMQAAMQKISWTKNADGSVRQLWETSKDGGATWTTSFDGKYVRKQR